MSDFHNNRLAILLVWVTMFIGGVSTDAFAQSVERAMAGARSQPPASDSGDNASVHSGMEAQHGSALPRVVLLVFEDTDEEVLQIIENLQSRMFEVDVKFGVRRLAADSQSADSMLNAARAFLEREHVQLVIYWNSVQRNQLYYVLKGTEEALERSVDDVGESSRSEAISIIVRTAVESLLESGDLTTYSREPASRESDASRLNPPVASPGAAADDVSRKPNEKPRDRDRIRRRGPVFQLAYQMALANSSGPLVHAAMGRLGYPLFAHVRPFVAVGMTSHLTSAELGFRVRQMRVPIEFGALVTGEKNRFVVGGGAALAMVLLKNEPFTQNSRSALKDAYWTRGSFLHLLVECQYNITDHTGIYADFLLLIQLNMVTYKVQNGPVLFDELATLWPGIELGVTISLF